MNWVGGSRSRLVMKNNERKQREFFEKRRMQQRLRHLEVPLPATSTESDAASLDLLTLFVVNQIGAKKENKDPAQIRVLGKGGPKHQRRESLELPMSPCSPSQLSLAESRSPHSAKKIKRRIHVIPQGFKCRRLSPVLESAFSDFSASDYLPPAAHPLSPFSSVSSASSGQSGMFPLQFSLQQTSQTSHDTEIREYATQQGRFSFGQPVDTEPMCYFSLNKSENEQQLEDDVFRGFYNEEHEIEGRSKLKIYLRDEMINRSAAPQTVPDSEVEVELSNCSHTNLSAGSGHKTGLINRTFEHLPSVSCRGAYLSSDSNDEEECSQLCFNSSAFSYKNQDTPRVNQGSQGKPKQIHFQPSPLKKAKKNLIENQKAMKDVSCPDEASRSNSAQCLSPHYLAQAQRCGHCQCKTKLSETCEAGTQTECMVATCEATTQCDSWFQAAEFRLCFPPVDMSVQHSATRRQSNTDTDPKAQQTSLGNCGGGMRMLSRNNSEEYSVSESCTVNQFIYSDRREILQSSQNPFIDGLNVADEKVKENGETRGDRGQQEHGPLMKDITDNVREEVTSATRVNRFSEEAKHLKK